MHLKQATFLYAANATVLRATDHMLGSLLDVMDDHLPTRQLED